MNCERIESQLIAYLDGKAPATAAREVETHLVACAACRARAEEFRRMWSVLDEAPAHQASLGFEARLRRAIAAEPRPAPFAWLIPSLRAAMAVAVLVLLSIWISSAPTEVENRASNVKAEEEFNMIRDLPVLEDYDVLANFEVLSELPGAKPPVKNEKM